VNRPRARRGHDLPMPADLHPGSMKVAKTPLAGVAGM